MSIRDSDAAFADDDNICKPPVKRSKKSRRVEPVSLGRITPPSEPQMPLKSASESQSAHSGAQQTLPEPLNVIIPIGGIGSRFQKEGYRFPKPLINIAGRPMLCWLIERLSLERHDTLWVAVNEVIDQEFQVGQLIRKWFPKIDTRLLPLKYLTKGATETVGQFPYYSLASWLTHGVHSYSSSRKI